MAGRQDTGMMDFEWADKTGPVSAASPFQTYAAQRQVQQAEALAKKRTFSDFSTSPSKAHTFPRLQNPTSGQTHLFAQPPASKPLPPTPWSRNPAFTTPRKPENEPYSSDIEPSTSPDNNADSEASPALTDDTMGAKFGFAKAGAALVRTLSSDSKPRRDSSPTRNTATSGRGEIARRLYSTAIEKRVRQRRTRDGGKSLSIFRKSSSDSDSEARSKGSKSTNGARRTTGWSITSILGFIDEHPGLPHTLAYWCQLFFNMLFGSAIVYLAYCTWSTIRSDVDKKSEEAMTAIFAEIAICAKEFKDNCQPTAPPALTVVCSNWEKCMNKDPEAVGRAKVSAHTFAEIFNSFMEPISLKAFLFLIIICAGWLTFSYIAFGLLRAKTQPQTVPAHHDYQYIQTPHRGFPVGSPAGHWPPFHSPSANEHHSGMPMLPPQTPSRALQYH